MRGLITLIFLCGALAGLAREIPLPQPTGGGVGFTRLGSEVTGIQFTNQISDIRAITNRNLLSGSGVALGDVDGDGWCDIYFCALDNNNVLYRNLGGWKFEDVTAAAGVACPGEDATGAVFADVDGDGDLDLFVAALGSGVRLFLNDGKGRFTENTTAAGLRSKAGTMSLALADIDGDGDLDLYVVNYRPTTLKDIPDAKFKVEYARGQPVITQFNGIPTTRPDLTNRFVLSPTGDVLELGEPDQLFINDGKGKFAMASFAERFIDEDGKPVDGPYLDWGLAAIFYDFTGDGAPDLYVCNDLFPPDRIWINDGKGRFRAIASTAIRSTSTFSMGVDFADFNRDGWPDFFVTDMRSRDHRKQHVQVGEMSSLATPPGVIDLRQQKGQNTLQLNRGDGTFAEISWYAGVESSEWSWGPIFLDVDLDGWEDLLISNGNQYDVQNADVAMEIERLKAANRLNHQELLGLLRKFPRLESSKLAFRNEGNFTFSDQAEKWGFNGKEISQGMALGDLDNDGDMDIVINNLFTAAAIYRNDAGAPRIAVRLEGAGQNTGGAGAKITMKGGPFAQTQEMLSGGRYLSGDQMMRVFAAPEGDSNLEITWRGGRKTVIEKVKPNHLYIVEEVRP
ncbi:MAG: CRTAC1 family protein [Limisphaerales bacterium]